MRKRFLFTTKWGSITAKINWSGEGNRTTSHDTSNKAISTCSKINPIHISIHILQALDDLLRQIFTGFFPVILYEAGGVWSF
ncbi:TPA: hypothetical protein ACIJMX_000569 [Escherichia coli]